jgi:hypothetical protein
MALSDDDLTRLLDSVPMVEPPDLRMAVLASLRAPVPLPASGERVPEGRVRGGAPRLKSVPTRRSILIGLAWAAAVVIVVGVAVERASLSRSQSSAAVAPASAEEWPVVARASAPGGSLTIRRNGDRFAFQPSVTLIGPISIDWDRSKLSKEGEGEQPLILRRLPGTSGPAEVRLSAAGREILKTSVE